MRLYLQIFGFKINFKLNFQKIKFCSRCVYTYGVWCAACAWWTPCINSIKLTGVCTALNAFSPLFARCPYTVLYGAYQLLLAMCLLLRDACPQCVRNSLSSLREERDCRWTKVSNLLGGDLDWEWTPATQCILYTQPCQLISRHCNSIRICIAPHRTRI